MKQYPLLPQDLIFWHLAQRHTQHLQQNITTDTVIIGGGMAGLMAAQEFARQGRKVVVIEKNFCGSGASGKSSGFITPDSELGLSNLLEQHGAQKAREIWDFISHGSHTIKKNILDYGIDCDYQAQDTLVLASSKKAYTKEILTEHAARTTLGYSSTLHTAQELTTILGSHAYFGGVSYGDSFGINGFRYCQGMKKVVLDMGVQIYEETPAVLVQDHLVTTPHGSIKAEHIIVCTDHYTPALKTMVADNIYHAQTFMMVSAPLTDADINKIFLKKSFMAWDTDMIYQYFRVTGDNRLLLGGASLLYTYATHEKHNSRWMINKLSTYWQKHFPQLDPQWEYIWPGLIGISKDLFPIAGRDPNIPSVFYATAAAGLPWAAALGIYSAQHCLQNITKFDDLLSPQRSFKIGSWTQKVVGKRLAFALNNFLTVGSL